MGRPGTRVRGRHRGRRPRRGSPTLGRLRPGAGGAARAPFGPATRWSWSGRPSSRQATVARLTWWSPAARGDVHRLGTGRSRDHGDRDEGHDRYLRIRGRVDARDTRGRAIAVAVPMTIVSTNSLSSVVMKPTRRVEIRTDRWRIFHLSRIFPGTLPNTGRESRTSDRPDSDCEWRSIRSRATECSNRYLLQK